jgi:hypothetical protein
MTYFYNRFLLIFSIYRTPYNFISFVYNQKKNKHNFSLKQLYY